MMRAAIVVAALPAALCAAAAPSRDFYRNGTSLPSLGPRPYVSAIVMSYGQEREERVLARPRGLDPVLPVREGHGARADVRAEGARPRE